MCKDGTYAPTMRARATFFSKKHSFLGLTPVYSETTALSKPYFIIKRGSVRKFLRKRLLFKKQKVDSTDYYGLEDPFPDIILKLFRFRRIQQWWRKHFFIGQANSYLLFCIKGTMLLKFEFEIIKEN